MESLHNGHPSIDIEYVRNLESKNNMMSVFLDNSEAGIYATDYLTGEILFANKKMVTIGGKQTSLDELVGQVCWKLIHKEGEGRCPFCPHEKLLVGGKPAKPYAWEQYFEEYGFWLKVISQVITWTDGRLAQINTFYDITEIKNMQKQIAEHAKKDEQWRMQSNLHMVLESLPLPVRIVDAATEKIVYVNHKCLELLGYTDRDALVGRSILSLLPDMFEDGTKPQDRINEILACNGVSNAELEYLTSSGELIITRLTSCVIDYNGRKSSVGIITDLSLEKEQQRLLLQAAEKEHEANQLKSNFLSNMSHEIRTPMNAIIGLTEIEMNKNPPLEMMRVFTKVNGAAKSLLQIINDILDLSKIEANKIELFPVEFELEEVLNSALSMAVPRLKGKRVELLLDYALDLPRYVVGDKTRLWQILRNHLDNAAKFTTEGSIVLRVEENKDLSSQDYISISFTIADTGKGMTRDQLAKAFLPYEQLFEDIDVRNSGSGLGLPISKQLCELMGGTMEMESVPGKGTTLCLTIPFVRSRNAATETRLLEGLYLSGLSVLLVDDSELVLHSIGALLGGCGAEFVVARSGEEALDMVHKRNDASKTFDIILIDYLMEGINGVEALRLIRREISYDPLILMLTSYECLLNKDDLASCGIADVIEKPVIPAHFISRLKGIMEYGATSANKNAKPPVVFVDTRILICEDVEINQEVIAAMLEQFGIRSVIAKNGKEGMDILNSGEVFDMIFMDLHMPVMSGYEATRLIRSSPKYKNIPIISMSADAMVETRSKCLEVGMVDCIVKPIELAKLERVLQRWLPKHKIKR